MTTNINDFSPGKRGDNLATPRIETPYEIATVTATVSRQATQTLLGDAEHIKNMQAMGRWPASGDIER